MKTFKAGTPVRLVQPVIEGVVVGGKLAEIGDDIDYQVAYTLPSGEVHVRHFLSSELEGLEGGEAKRVLDQHDNHLDSLREQRELEAVHAARHEREQGGVK